MGVEASADLGLRRLIDDARPSLALPRGADVPGVLILAFRWIVIGCQAAALLITWPLWQVHTSPPMLPALPLPAIDLGVALLISLAVALAFPRPGFLLHTLLLLYAVAIDQTRLQPGVVSLAFLMWGTLPSSTARTLARAHLVSMWFFAGLNKLLSPDFLHGMAQWILSAFVRDPPSWLSDHIGYVIALSEMGIGVLAFLPWTRRAAALAAFGLHVGILLDLLPTGHDWNPSVWPWNVALAFAGFALIAPWRGSPFTSLGHCHRLARPLVVLLVVAPVGFYVGITDAYLAHNLYSNNTARATVRCADRCLPNQRPQVTWSVFNVPLPPEHRLFRQYFEQTCRAGDQLIIRDSRWWFRRQGLDVQQMTCPADPRPG